MTTPYILEASMEDRKGRVRETQGLRMADRQLFAGDQGAMLYCRNGCRFILVSVHWRRPSSWHGMENVLFRLEVECAFISTARLGLSSPVFLCPPTSME